MAWGRSLAGARSESGGPREMREEDEEAITKGREGETTGPLDQAE